MKDKKINEVYTISEITEEFNLKRNTLTGYITRGQVIPKDKMIKKGEQWLIDKAWIDEKYKDKKRKKMKNKKRIF